MRASWFSSRVPRKLQDPASPGIGPRGLWAAGILADGLSAVCCQVLPLPDLSVLRVSAQAMAPPGKILYLTF